MIGHFLQHSRRVLNLAGQSRFFIEEIIAIKPIIINFLRGLVLFCPGVLKILSILRFVVVSNPLRQFL